MKESENDLDDDITNEPLEFSDHAALYDQYIDENTNTDELTNSKYLNEHKRRLLLDNYDIYTKKNYKLTYNNLNNKSNQNISNSRKRININNRQQIINNADSLASSALMEQINNLDESNYMEEEGDIDEDQNEYTNQKSDRLIINQYQNQNNAAHFKNDYYAYLHSLKKQANEQQMNSELFSSMNSSNQQISDSIMNWSMKISNYNSTQSNRKRSKSRTPPMNNQTSGVPRSNSSFSKFYNQENLLEESVNLSPPIQFRNNDRNDYKNSLSANAKSTTSWGKLKHSKSSSSNIGCSIDDQEIPNNTEFTQTRTNKIHIKPYRRNHTTNNILSECNYNEERPQSMNNPQIRYIPKIKITYYNSYLIHYNMTHVLHLIMKHDIVHLNPSLL